MIQMILIFGIALVFFVMERVLPGRELPAASGWYHFATLLRDIVLALFAFAIGGRIGVLFEARR